MRRKRYLDMGVSDGAPYSFTHGRAMQEQDEDLAMTPISLGEARRARPMAPDFTGYPEAGRTPPRSIARTTDTWPGSERARLIEAEKRRRR